MYCGLHKRLLFKHGALPIISARLGMQTIFSASKKMLKTQIRPLGCIIITNFTQLLITGITN
jgi:hypothetical protein